MKVPDREARGRRKPAGQGRASLPIERISVRRRRHLVGRCALKGHPLVREAEETEFEWCYDLDGVAGVSRIVRVERFEAMRASRPYAKGERRVWLVTRARVADGVLAP